MAQRTRVLVVDDSALMRQLISRMLEQAGMDVVGTAKNGQEGLEEVKRLRPDVVTLDVEMPVMNGLEMLERLMRESPVPVVMISSLTKGQAPAAVKALSLGAVDVVGKPGGSISLDIATMQQEIVRKVRAAARAKVRQPSVSISRSQPPPRFKPRARRAPGCVVVGSSTGGPSALSQLLPALPEDFPWPVLVVQHMPEGFTASLAARLNEMCRLRVQEAYEGANPSPGEVWIARAGKHLRFAADGRLTLGSDPPQRGVRPAVDVTLSSAADVWGKRTVGVILTGMGFDGVAGARRVKAAGGTVIAQDEATCVVYGMPRAVVETGLADVVSPLGLIPETLCRIVDERSAG